MNDHDPFERAPRRPRNHENAAGEDRLPPHSPEAERGVLGCLLADPSLIDVARSKLKRGGEEFYDLRHRKVFDTLCELEDSRRPVDLITLVQSLRESNNLEAIGGILYLNEIIDSTPSAQNLETYLGDVRDRATMREMLRACVQAQREIHENPGDVTGLVAKFQATVSDLTETHVVANYAPIVESMALLIPLLEERRRGKNAITGIPTPWFYLNNMTAGLQHGEYSIIAARPSTGKTAMCLDIAIHAATEGIPVLLFSIEMSAKDINMRLVANVARMNGLKLRNGFWRDDKEPAMAEAFGKICSLPLYLNDSKSITALDMLLITRRAVREKRVQLVVVDYAQKIQAYRKRNTIQEELTDASGMLARIAKELNVHVCVAAQLSRDAEKDRAGRRPYLSDIKESGSFEQDADLVGLLWEPKIDDGDDDDMKWLKHHEPDDPKDDSKWFTHGPREGWRDEFRRIDLTVGKNRNGPVGDCELVMQKASARFVDAHSPERTKAIAGRLI